MTEYYAARWRKKPVEVEAVQWTGANLDEVQALTGSSDFCPVEPEDRGEGPDQTAEVYDKLHLTWVRVYDGQWIIKGVKGEFYPCADDVFRETYEPVTAACDGFHEPGQCPRSEH